MQVEVISASYQKIGKLSVSSSDSSDRHTDFPSIQNVSEFSIFPQEDLEDLIMLLKSTLCSKISQMTLPSTPSEVLKHLVRTLCTEYQKLSTPIQELYLKNFRDSIEEVSVNLLKANKKDPITRIFKLPENGTVVNREECKELSALIIGAVRDSASHGLKQEIGKLQEKVISFATANSKLKEKLRNKSQEVEDLVEKLKDLQDNASRNSRKYILTEITKSCEQSIDQLKIEFS